MSAEKAEEAYAQIVKACGQHSSLADCEYEIKRAIEGTHGAGLFSLVKQGFAALMDGERAEIVSDYCKACWCDDPRCQCSNDE